ncbi:MAG: reverse transcriptase domain-containing protein, partial [bacterium]
MAQKKLNPSFRTASIKLIPKKGDTTRLKNWRPISLLSCLYKVTSRALNNRLKVASGFIFSRAQKGFTKNIHIQEVLINVIEMIAHCNEYQIPG